MSLKPLHDRVLIRRLDSKEVTVGGIIIPDSAKEKPAEGIVIATGKGQRGRDGSSIPMEIEIGDNVMFGAFAGTEISIAGEELVILREADVIAVMEPEAKKKKAKTGKKKSANSKAKSKTKPKSKTKTKK